MPDTKISPSGVLAVLPCADVEEALAFYTNTLGFTEAYTIFHNTEMVGVTDYTMTMDVWMELDDYGDAAVPTAPAAVDLTGDAESVFGTSFSV